MMVTFRFDIVGPGNPGLNQDEEDIDIVGDHGAAKIKSHNTSSMSSHSNEGSADCGSTRLTSMNRGEFQKGLYGSPQFTEADVLACMSEIEKDEGKKYKKIQVNLFRNRLAFSCLYPDFT